MLRKRRRQSAKKEKREIHWQLLKTPVGSRGTRRGKGAGVKKANREKIGERAEGLATVLDRKGKFRVFEQVVGEDDELSHESVRASFLLCHDRGGGG